MSKHIKRLSVPRTWDLPRKTAHWAPKPRPGPHGQDEGVPLVVALRDVLEICDTAAEAKRILGDRNVQVDGRIVTDPRRPLGLMDVLTLVPEEQHYRVLRDRKGVIGLVEIDADRSGWKLARIEDKTTVKGGKIQLNLHDGRNILIKEGDHATGDVLRITVPDQEIKNHYPLEEGHVAFITGGTHAGEVATIRRVEVVRSSRPNNVYLEAGDRDVQTITPYVFVVGRDKPEIVLPEVSIVD